MSKQKLDDTTVLSYILDCREEAKSAKHERMELNKDNYDMYHMRHDFSHKTKGQSKEILSRQRMSTETTKSSFQQALADLGEFYKVTPTDGTSGETMPIRPEEIQKLLNHFLTKAMYFDHVGDSVQQGLLGALAISRVCGKMVPAPKYVATEVKRGRGKEKILERIEDTTWELSFESIRQENYYPDPQGEGLYEIYETFMDLGKLKKFAESEYTIYDKTKVAEIQPIGTGDSTEEFEKSRETGQNTPIGTFRPRVKLTRFYGTIVDRNTGDILAENVYATIANDSIIIQPPTENPYWHQSSDIVAAPLLKVANSVWHIALMDAPTKHNHSLIELFNLMLDSAMKATYGINQIRTDYLKDARQVANGIKWGESLEVTAGLPIQAKVLEQIVTGDIPPEVFNMFALLGQEYSASALTTDVRQGIMPSREQKATAVVEASNSIATVFNGVAKNVEEKLTGPELQKGWMEIAQNFDKIQESVFISLFGEERGRELKAMSPEEVFAATVNGVKFQVFGISLMLKRASDFRKWTTFLQTIGGSEALIEAFVQKYDFGKILGEIMSSLDIDKKKIELDAPQAPPPGMGGGPTLPGTTPDMMSQVPSGVAGIGDLFGQMAMQGSPNVAGRNDQ